MITHDSWKRIKEIFQSAQELKPEERSDFLDRACGDDKSLREEVEALLTADASNEDFLSAPAYEFAASIIAGEEVEFAAGQKIGPYTILCPLGAGGMGQIYLAEDANLRRKIALKFISPQFASDESRVQRFKQEALAASALNHPNICVIHALGTTESGRNFIAMEYIQGNTLRQQLSRGRISVSKALNIAIEIATALSSAHASGIVHRDIKPENIMVRPDGYVKVLDFGLAKLTEVLPAPADTVATNVHTETGMLMGTVKYMSPEQLRDTKVDERADIWSLGIVLYEMLTGSTPFEARTSNETVAAILAPQPSPLKFPEGIPKQLQDIISNALQKEREHRYQTVTKFATDLSRLRASLRGQTESELYPVSVRGDEQQTRKIESSGLLTRLKSQAIDKTEFILSEIRSHKRAALFTGVTGVLFLLFFLPAASRYINSVVNRPTRPAEMTPLTNAGTSVCSAISRDGKWLAHAEEKAGKQRLVLTNIETAASSDIVAPSEAQYVGVTFTRDGNYLYFTRNENTRGMLYRFALPGGPPVKIKDGVDSPITFSPQQDRFAFVRFDRNTVSYSLMISAIDGSSEQVLAARQNGDVLSLYGPAWSPDGSLIVSPVRSWSNNGFGVTLMGFDVKSGREKSLSEQPWFAVLQIAWLDDMSGLIMSARDRATAPVRLWRLTYPGGELAQITSDLAEYRGVSLAGKDILTVRTEWTWDLVVTSAAKDFADPSIIASGVWLTYGVNWADNRRIVYSAMAQDSLNISRINADGSNQVPLTTRSQDNYFPSGSADGRYIVFSSNRTGKFNLWRMTVDGSDLKQLTFSDGNFCPTVSHDNQWIAYDNQTSRQKSVWKVPLEGGEAIKVADGYRMPAFSPDNQFIATRYDLESGTSDVVILNADSGELWKKISIPNFDWQRVQWPSQNTLSYIEKINGYPNIVSYDIVSGEKKQLTNFNRNQIFSYAWSPDYKLLASQLGTKTSNVVKIRNEK